MKSYTNIEVVTIRKSSPKRSRSKRIDSPQPHRPDAPMQLELPFIWPATEGGSPHV